MEKTLKEIHDEAKAHLVIGKNYILHGEIVELLDFEDELTCSVMADWKTSYTQPKKHFWNKIYGFFNWPLDIEIVESSYKRTKRCSYYMLEEII